jgi:hypothetical protein
MKFRSVATLYISYGYRNMTTMADSKATSTVT